MYNKRRRIWVPATGILGVAFVVLAVFLFSYSAKPASSINLTAEDRALIQRHNAFGFNVFRQLCADGGRR